MSKAIVIVSGGLDSVTLAHLLAEQYYTLHLLSFNYGQRHIRELEYAAMCAHHLGAEHDLIDLSAVTPFLTGSALTDSVDVPEGHYAAPNMATTIVPNRNAMMLSVAYAVAIAEKARAVAIGVHAGDHPIYPDCRPEFINSFSLMEHIGMEGYAQPELRAPFVWKTKADIVRIGNEIGVPFAETWSCYKGGDKHCGRCGTCVERIEAFKLAGVADPTEYEDISFAEAELAGA